MANSIYHSGLPFPIYNAKYTLLVPYLDADGDPTDPTTPDTEVSVDAGSFADCAEEVTTITGSNGVGYITLTGAEMKGSAIAVCAKVASGPKATLALLQPRALPVLESGTAQAGGNTSITLASGAAAYDLTGCFVRTTGGTGGGGTNGANNQARKIMAYNVSTKEATVFPQWETNPSSDTTYDILISDIAVNSTITRGLRPTTDGRTLGVESDGDLTKVNTLDGHTPQTGDTFVRIGAAGAGLTALGDTRIANLDAAVSSRSSHSAADVWSSGTRTLSSFGSLVADIATAVWDAGTKTLTSFGTLVADTAAAVWATAVKVITGGTLTVSPPTAADIKNAIEGSGSSLAQILEDTGTTIPAQITTMRGADSDTLKTLSDQIDGISAGSAPTVEEIRQEIDSNSTQLAEIIADIATITGGTGSNAITITVTDGTTPIQDVTVEIWNAANTLFRTKGVTNSSGVMMTSLDDGTYTVRMLKGGYSFTNQTLTVDGVESVPYTGTAYVIPAPSSADLCRVYAYLKKADGTVPATVTREFVITELPEFEDGSCYAETDNQGVYNATTGLLYFDCVRGAQARVTVEGFGISHKITIPDAATAEIEDLI
jgi:hypothetical protein